jgi:hypothetical protein
MKFLVRLLCLAGAIVAPGFMVVHADSPANASPSATNIPTRLDEDMSAYRGIEASGAVSSLQKKIESGAVSLKYDERTGYLKALLEVLGIPSSSQLLVYSKTSPHRKFITPQNPRALFFNDRAYLAYVPGADVIEIAAADPKIGVVFYSLDQKQNVRASPRRDDRCLECHATSKTLNVPGLLVRSFLPAGDGEVALLGGKPMVTHRTPLAERWGGYYVTGTHGGQSHLGNIFGPEAIARHEREPTANGNVTNLKPFLDLSRYPATSSDIVALMVLEHQAHLQNLLTYFGAEATEAMRVHESLRPAYPAAEAVLKYMLFTDEALLMAPIQGTTDFANTFRQAAPKDSRGRSLAEFDLKSRLFTHPCSYMIYSPSFDALLPAAKKHFYRRLWEVLTGQEQSADFARLTRDQRRDIREILVATKPDLPAYWRLD